MFLELKSSLRASFLDLGTDPHLFFFETPFNLGKETEWEEQWQSRGQWCDLLCSVPEHLGALWGNAHWAGKEEEKVL